MIIIKEVIDGLVPSDKLVKVLSMGVSGHLYDTYYSVDKDLYLFEGASGIDLAMISSIWNHQ